MRTQHLPASRWLSTLDDLSRAYDDDRVAEILGGEDIGAQPEVLDQPVRALSSGRGRVMIRIAKRRGFIWSISLSTRPIFASSSPMKGR